MWGRRQVSKTIVNELDFCLNRRKETNTQEPNHCKFVVSAEFPPLPLLGHILKIWQMKIHKKLSFPPYCATFCIKRGKTQWYGLIVCRCRYTRTPISKLNRLVNKRFMLTVTVQPYRTGNAGGCPILWFRDGTKQLQYQQLILHTGRPIENIMLFMYEFRKLIKIESRVNY